MNHHQMQDKIVSEATQLEIDALEIENELRQTQKTKKMLQKLIG